MRNSFRKQITWLWKLDFQALFLDITEYQSCTCVVISNMNKEQSSDLTCDIWQNPEWYCFWYCLFSLVSISFSIGACFYNKGTVKYESFQYYRFKLWNSSKIIVTATAENCVQKLGEKFHKCCWHCNCESDSSVGRRQKLKESLIVRYNDTQFCEDIHSSRERWKYFLFEFCQSI